MTEITSQKIQIDSGEIHYLTAGRPEGTPIVLLHGMKFQATTWDELDTLQQLSDAGFHTVAIDMPGFGSSPACSVEQDRVLEEFFQELGLQNVILIGPSMGGRIALEFTINHPHSVKALVLVGSVGIEENNNNLSSINIPTLLVWGSEDQISPLTNCELLHSSIAGSKKIIIEGAPHPCYLDNPDIWHSELINFLNSLAK